MAGSARRGSVRPSTLRLRGAGGGRRARVRPAAGMPMCAVLARPAQPVEAIPFTPCPAPPCEGQAHSAFIIYHSPSPPAPLPPAGGRGRAPRAGASRSGYADVRGPCETGAAGRSNPLYPLPRSPLRGAGSFRIHHLSFPVTPCPAPACGGRGGGGRRARVRPTVGAAGSAQGFGPSLKPCRDGYRCMSGAHAGNTAATTVVL
jgi:hypothetical protein